MDDPAFAVDTTIDINTQTILLHASNHDLAALKPLLRIPGNASVQDPETGYTPLHAAIAACESAVDIKETNGVSDVPMGETEGEEVDIEKAKEVVRELFLSGAIWNDLDTNNETPGCLAWRLGQKALYELCVEAGVRAELLLGLMGGYEPLGDSDSEEEEEEEEEEADATATSGDTAEANGNTHELAVDHAEEAKLKRDVNSEDYLASNLTFTSNALLDSDANGVMMAWETEIMRRTVDLLIPDLKPGARVLNIGFGMGIIDRMFRDTKPLTHHIIEAHPGVLSKLEEADSDFGPAWKTSAPDGGSYTVHAGKWQDVLPTLLQAGEVYDAIYFDTFGEDYGQLKLFFTEFVPGLLDEKGRFGFFNGLGADRRVCYDVYTKVSELDLCDAGMDVEWTDVAVPLEDMQEEGQGEWSGVRRRYWTLETYRLPVCTFMG
jgi:protein arginine N-methyltransferase 2